MGGAAVAMVVVAELAVLLLSPREEVPDPVPVSEHDYFTPAELERAHDYRDPGPWLLLAGIAIEGAVLTAVAIGRPGSLRRLLERLGSRPLRGAAVAGASVSLLLTVAALPLGIVSHERAVDAGISTQDLGSWFWDLARSAGITAVLTAGATALLLFVVRRFGRHWWIPGAVLTTGLAALFVWIAPVLLAPIFNKFEPLPKSSHARAEVLALGREAGVDIGEVYRIDASRRVTSLNAFVDGIGSTKRVVLYDNLLEQAQRPELRSVVAHELGHVAGHDVRRGLIFVAVVAPFGLLFARELTGAIADRRGVDVTRPVAVPIYLAALALAAFVLEIPGNQLSRKIEAGADAFALRLTDDPKAMIDLQVELARANVSDPDPPALLHDVFGTHPTTVERIGAALSFERER